MIYYCTESWWYKVKKIMFVCSGNICRSVMAKYLLCDILEKNNLESNYEVYSSGVFAYNGQTPPKETIETMMSRSIDVSNHRATSTDNSNIHNMDLILCMTNAQKLQLKTRYKELEPRIYTLKEYVIYDDGDNKDIDIEDPYKGSWAIYLECLRQIDICLNKLIKIIE